MHKIIAIHLLLRFNPVSFMTDTPAFFARFPMEIGSKKISVEGGGFGNTHWLKIFRVDGNSMSEQDRIELTSWLAKQNEARVIDCLLDNIKAEPFAPSTPQKSSKSPRKS